MLTGINKTNLPHNPSPSQLVYWARLAYCAIAIVFAGCLVVQVFFAGMAVFFGPSYWGMHRAFGQAIQWGTILLLIAGIVGRLPWRMQLLNGLLIALFAFQYIFLLVLPRFGIPLVQALHAANALALFGLTITLAQRAWQIWRATAGQRASVE